MDEREVNDLTPEGRRKLDELPRAIGPARDLWPDIRRRIAAEAQEQPARAPFGGWLRAAAIALALLGGGVLLGRFGAPEQEQEPAPLADAGPRAEQGIGEARPASVLPTDEEWAAASAQVLAALADSTSNMDPATREVVRRNLEIIDGAVRDIRTALEADPSNEGLQRLLTAEYRRRGALLRRAATDTPM